MKISGLNRKQISNWITRKVRKLGIDRADIPSANMDPTENPADIAECKGFLESAWEKGLLPGTENYKLIQDLTNLSRKQIANWTGRKMRKLKKDQLKGNIVTQSSQMMMRTPQQTRKRSLKVEKERLVKRRVAVSGQGERPVMWLLQNAARDLANINEEKLGLLSIIIGYPKEKIRKYLLAHGRSIEKDGGSLTEQLTVMESTHTVSGQQQNTYLEPKVQPELDKPLTKIERIEEVKEKIVKGYEGYLIEQVHSEVTHQVPEQQQNTSLQPEAQTEPTNH